MRVARALFLYNAAVYLVFVGLYRAIGFNKKHFSMPDADENDTLSAMYFAWVAHTSTGFGDIAPRSRAARGLVMAHLCLAWATLAAVLVFGGGGGGGWPGGGWPVWAWLEAGLSAAAAAGLGFFVWTAARRKKTAAKTQP